MEKALFGIPNMDVYIVMGILLFFFVIEVLAGYLSSTKRTKKDWILEMGGYLALGLGIKPLIVLSALYLGHTFLPQFQYILGDSSIWLVLPLYLFIDDLMQYWYHRSAHEYEFLWKLHRPHHQAEEMGFFVAYRNAALYYFIMPNIWWVGIVTFLGGAKAVAIGLIIKQIIIISSHSTLQYDKWLNQFKFLSPILSVWERIFITPAFHHAHHGKTKRDGISDPNGNFGNMFSLWDQLFGTAHFTRQFPLEYGLENDPKESWTANYLYPLVASSDPKSELSRGFKKSDTTSLEPAEVHLEKGKNYLYCACGMSQNQPFCDSSHHGTKYKPLLFEVKKTGAVRLCNCKHTKAKPFCDDSHVEFK